jgi:hypothetical protein
VIRSIEQFNSDQETKRELIANQLEGLECEIKEIANDSCKESMRDFKRKYNLKITDDDDEGAKDNKNADDEPFLVGDGSHK